MYPTQERPQPDLICSRPSSPPSEVERTKNLQVLFLLHLSLPQQPWHSEAAG